MLIPIGAFRISLALLINAVRGGPTAFAEGGQKGIRQYFTDLAKRVDKGLGGARGLALATPASFAVALPTA
ncbi:MAG: hypothetical protein QXP98_04030 [Thermoproteus sp.]